MPAPRPALSPAELARYSRQILLEEVGLEGQQRLAAARVLVVGAGGLGSPAALYLAAAGVGVVGIADFDRVEEHNLQRQLLHDRSSVGEHKVASAARRLRATNPFVKIREHGEGVTARNGVALFGQYDVIIDGTDRFATRYLTNDAAFFARRPLVHGSVYKFEGHVSVFEPARGGPCYRCLFPEPPPPGSVPGCGEAGVMGALCGVIGSMQALEAIKLVTGVGEPLRGRMLAYDALRVHFQVLALPRDHACPLCGDQPSLTRLQPFNSPPGNLTPPSPSQTATMTEDSIPIEISVTEAKRLQDSGNATTRLIDVREDHELQICRLAGAEHIPMREIPNRMNTLPRDQHLLVLCHSGGRSRRVTDYLRAQGFDRVSNIAGGIDAWAREIDPKLPRY